LQIRVALSKTHRLIHENAQSRRHIPANSIIQKQPVCSELRYHYPSQQSLRLCSGSTTQIALNLTIERCLSTSPHNLALPRKRDSKHSTVCCTYTFGARHLASLLSTLSVWQLSRICTMHHRRHSGASYLAMIHPSALRVCSFHSFLCFFFKSH
jgi:hypothetical protein